jgi:hypothetical protein
VTRAPYAPAAERPALHAALTEASVGAFHLWMEIAAALAVLGGLVSLAGIEPLSPAAR